MSLEQVLTNLEKWHQEKRAGCEAIARNIAAKAQGKARALPKEQSWQDRSGNARQGLKGGMQWDSFTALIIYLAHSVDYGPYLELCNDGKHAVLEKTLNSLRKELYDSLKRIMNA